MLLETVRRCLGGSQVVPRWTFVMPGGREWGMGPGLLGKKGRSAAWAGGSTFHFHRSSRHTQAGWVG